MIQISYMSRCESSLQQWGLFYLVPVQGKIVVEMVMAVYFQAIVKI